MSTGRKEQIPLERWEQIKGIFEAAVDLDPADRATYLNSTCSGDQLLRKEVEVLLSYDNHGWELLERPAYEFAAVLLEEPQPTLKPGEEVGHYDVIRQLGKGGMGEVYLALDRSLGREIALKVLPADYLTRDRVQRFHQEARAASALNHPNIVTIYEISQIEGRHFIATEFIDGETLRQRLHRGQLTVIEALQIAIQVAEALAAAHRAGIVHRDVKPENIMLRTDGYVKVLDFGLAKLVGQSESTTEAGAVDSFDISSGLVMGTVKYMSPEQARAAEVDSRSDIFSLSVVLYEMVVGRTPFEGQTARDLVASIQQDDPAPLSQYSPQLPNELQQVISKALRKEKEDRYQTIRELLNDLKSVKEKLELENKPLQIPSRAEYIISEVKRRRTTMIGMVAVLFISASALAIVTYKFISQPKSAASSQNIRITKLTSTGRSGAAVISPDGKYVAYLTFEDREPSLWVREMATDSNVQVMTSSRALYQGLTFSPDGNYLYYAGNEPGEREIALYQVPAPFGGAARKLITGVDYTFALSPDGNSVTFVRDEKELIVANLDGSGERTLATRQLPDSFTSAAWAPDGKRIACHGMSKSAGGDVVEVEVASGMQRTITQRWGWIQQVAWLTDGSGLVLSAVKEGSTTQLWQLSYPGGEIRRITTDLNNYHSLSLTADSRTLVTTQSQQVLNLWVVPTGEQERARQITTGSGREGWSGVAWSPDGRIVYSSFASGNPEIWIMDADGSNKKQLTVGLGSNNFGLSVSPDGRYILFVSSRAGSIWRVDIDGSNPKQLTDGFGLNPLCSPDSQWVYYTGERFHWKVPIDGGEPVQVSGPYSNILAFSPDGNLTAYLTSEGNPAKVGITSFEGVEPVTVFERLENVTRYQWAPDSSALTYFSSRGGASNIWSQPIAGGSPKRLTDFEPGLKISSFAWSRDGKQLAVSRSEATTDVVLIKNFR